MNKIYKTVFNQKTGQLVAVQETASGYGHGSATVTASGRAEALRHSPAHGLSLRPLQLALWGAFFLGSLAWVPAPMAAPVGGVVQAGSASINQSGLTTTVRNAPGTVINWQGFNIAPNELVQFLQQNANSAVLNRVVGAGGSELLGMLQSNGRVFLINGNGILIGPRAQINTAGFVASTLNISDRDFAEGKLRFQKDSGAAGASVINQGHIQVSPGGLVALLGGTVQNNGVIQVDNGQVLLAAGQGITLVDINNPSVSFIVSAPANEVVNLGQILANESTVQLQGGTIQQSGAISANSAHRDAQGRIVLSAIGSAVVSGDINANNTAGQAGEIIITGAAVQVDAGARINAQGQQGGAASTLVVARRGRS